MQLKHLLALLLLSTPIFCRPPIVVIGIPKCGTHLLSKLVGILTGRSVIHADTYAAPLKVALARRAPQSAHAHYNEQNLALLAKHQARILFIYRDPRDQAVSYTNWRAHAQRSMPVTRRPFGVAIPPKLACAAKKGELLTFISEHTTEAYARFMPWKNHPSVCVVRFEDLVGASGGGSREKQLAVIKKVAQHIDVPLDNKQAAQVAEQLFGGTHTFRKGQIGSWKEAFTPEQRQLFKDKNQALLEELGYEADESWVDA